MVPNFPTNQMRYAGLFAVELFRNKRLTSLEFGFLGERQNEAYPPLAPLDPPGGRVKSLSPWESLPEGPERV